MDIIELILRSLIFVVGLYTTWLVFKLIVAGFRALPRVLNLLHPRSLGRASAFIERKAKSAAQSFQDGRRS